MAACSTTHPGSDMFNLGDDNSGYTNFDSAEIIGQLNIISKNRNLNNPEDPLTHAIDALAFRLAGEMSRSISAGKVRASDYVNSDVKRIHDAAVVLITNLDAAKTDNQKCALIQNFETAAKKTTSGWKVFGAVAAGVIVAAAFVAFGVGAGFVTGFLCGLWSGPGAFFTALAGAAAGASMTTATISAIATLAAPPVVAAVTGGATTAFFLMKKSKTEHWANDFKKAVVAHLDAQLAPDLVYDSDDDSDLKKSKGGGLFGSF